MKDCRITLKMRNTFRLIDDISTLNSDDIFQELVCEIYPSSLELNKENDNDNGADILDLNVIIKDGKFICNFMISVVNFIFRLFKTYGGNSKKP